MATSERPSRDPYTYSKIAEERVVELADAEDFNAAAALCRPWVVLTASIYGADCLMTVRAVLMMAMIMDQIDDAQSEREAQTWAHVALVTVLKLMIEGQGEYDGIAPNEVLAGFVGHLREVFPEVWDQRDTFQRIGEPDFETGELIWVRS